MSKLGLASSLTTDGLTSSRLSNRSCQHCKSSDTFPVLPSQWLSSFEQRGFFLREISSSSTKPRAKTLSRMIAKLQWGEVESKSLLVKARRMRSEHKHAAPRDAKLRCTTFASCYYWRSKRIFSARSRFPFHVAGYAMRLNKINVFFAEVLE